MFVLPCLWTLRTAPIHKKIHIHMGKSFFSFSVFLEKRDQIAIADALLFSADLKPFSLGNQIHSHVIKWGFSNDIFSQNNLVKMYFKVGVSSYGCKVFEEMAEKNLVSWTIVISGAIQNINFELGLNTYFEMLRVGLRPNEFTLGSVMKACATIGVHTLVIAIHCSALKIGLEQNPFNDRAKYVNTFMDHLVSWDAAMGCLVRAEAFVNLGEPKIPIA